MLEWYYEMTKYLGEVNTLSTFVRLALALLCGGILGMDADTVVLRMRSSLPHSFKAASGKSHADGVIFTLDTSSGRVTEVTPVGF